MKKIKYVGNCLKKCKGEKSENYEQKTRIRCHVIKPMSSFCLY